MLTSKLQREVANRDSASQSSCQSDSANDCYHLAFKRELNLFFLPTFSVSTKHLENGPRHSDSQRPNNSAGIHWLALKEEMKKAQTHCPHCPHPHYTHQYFVPAPVGKQGRLLISSGGSLKFEYRLLLSNTECLFFWAPNNPINMMNLSWSDLCNTANASEGKLRITFQHWRIFIEQKVHCPSYSAYFSIFKVCHILCLHPRFISSFYDMTN